MQKASAQILSKSNLIIPVRKLSEILKNLEPWYHIGLDLSRMPTDTCGMQDQETTVALIGFEPDSALMTHLITKGFACVEFNLSLWLADERRRAGSDLTVIHTGTVFDAREWVQLERILKDCRYPAIIILAGVRISEPPEWVNGNGYLELVDAGTSAETLLMIIQRTLVSSDVFVHNKRLQAALHQYEQLVSRIQMGLFRFRYDLGNNYLIDYISPRIAELTGVARELLETDIHAFMDTILPEDYEQYLEKARRAFREHKPVDIRVRVLVKGRLRIMLVRFNPQTDEPETESGLYYCNGSIEDITESFMEMEHRNRIIEAVGILKNHLDGFQELVSEPVGAKLPDDSLLSNRERGVLELIKLGLQNKEIAARLGISESTVKKHVVAIFGKTGVSRRAELMVPMVPIR